MKQHSFFTSYPLLVYVFNRYGTKKPKTPKKKSVVSAKTLKNVVCFILFVVLLSANISCDSNKAELKNFAVKFAETVSKNMVDSVRTIYPDAAKIDSFALVYNVDSIVVNNTEDPSVFQIVYSKDAEAIISKASDGMITIKETRGFAAFPEEIMEFAKNTGQWKEGLSDVVLAERIADVQFKSWLVKSFANKMKESLKVKDKPKIQKMSMGTFEMNGIMGVTVENKSDFTVQGKDYYVVFEGYFAVQGYIEKETQKEKGKDIGSNETVNITTAYNDRHSRDKAYIKISISDEELFNKYFKGTGNEFEEYLKENPKD